MEKKTKNMLIEWLKVPIVINSVHWGPEDIYGTQIGSFGMSFLFKINSGDGFGLVISQDHNLKNKSTTPWTQLRIQLFFQFLLETGYWNWIFLFFHFFPMQICKLHIFALMPNWHVWCMHLTFFSRQSNHIT